MKLFLTSAGFATKKLQAFLLLHLENVPENFKVAMLSLIQNDNEQYYADLSKKEMESMGFKHVMVINLANSVSDDVLDGANIIYVCGGNTFSIYKRIRELGLDKKIIEKVKNNVIYVGVSAGSIIAGPSLEIANWGSEGDENTVGLEDLGGLSLANVSIFPHYRSELKTEVEEFRKIVNYPVVKITNEQLVYIEGEKIEIV